MSQVPKERTLQEYFLALRCDPAHHLGLGDVRLTLGQQDELITRFSEGKSGWISTERRKPDDEQRVLGWWPAARNSTDGYDVVLYHAADAPDGPESWRYTDESSADAPDYWMPLEALGRPE